MLRSIILLPLLTLIFSQNEGEIVNVTAAQRIDGSGIVDISYELLPDDTFPSFEVSAYQLNGATALLYEENEDGSVWSVYLNSGPNNISRIYLDFECMDFFAGAEWDWYITPSVELTEYGFSVDIMIEDRIEINPSEYDGTIFIPEGVSNLLLFTFNTGGDTNYELNCEPSLSLRGGPDLTYSTWYYLNIYDAIWAEYGTNIASPISVLGDGIGENIFPGIYNLTWQVPSGYYSPNLQIRIVAYAHIVDTPLPFDMVTIPPGTYYDTNSEEQTMGYSYEIMKHELTNTELLNWAFSLNEEDLPLFCGNDMQTFLSYIGGTFLNINYDGTTIELEPGFGALSVNIEQGTWLNGGGHLLQYFADYYGLRIPTTNEWLYAARGSADVPFPWFEGEWQCEDTEYLEQTCENDPEFCGPDCYLDQLCSNGLPLFEMCNENGPNECLYISGDNGPHSNNISPFGLYDMIGNAAEIIIGESGFMSLAGQLQFALGDVLMWSGWENVSLCELNADMLENYGVYYDWISGCGYDASLILGQEEGGTCWENFFDTWDENSNYQFPAGVRLVRTVVE